MSLRITLEKKELYDEEQNRFYYADDLVVELEHSLSAISKWEAIHRKPFFGKEDKTTEETFDYIKCMIVSKDVDPNVVYLFTDSDISKISEYINAPMTATWFSKMHQTKASSEIITAEIIYYWMLSMNISLEWENRHLNQLLTLIRVTSLKNAPDKKMSKADIMRRNHALNQQRRAAAHSRG